MESLDQLVCSSSNTTTGLNSIENYVNLTLNCKRTKNLAHANHVHMCISDVGLDTQVTIGNFLVPMFVECGSINIATQVFNKLIVKKEHSWTSLIQGYIESKDSEKGIFIFQTMREELVIPSMHSFVAVLKASTKLKWLDTGQEIHMMVCKYGHECDRFIGSTLIDMYAKCGLLVDAQDVFDDMKDRNVVTWTAIIAGYAENGLYDEAIECWEQMQKNDVFPNSVTLLCCLKAVDSIEVGQKLHYEIVKEGFDSEMNIGNTLIDIYSKCGFLHEACEVFNEMPIKDVVSWTALIAGYVEQGLGEDALASFEEMLACDICPNAVAYSCALKACTVAGALECGQEMHAEILKHEAEDFFIGNMLIDMYAKCGALEEARDIFRDMPCRDIVSWNTLISGFVEHKLCEEALSVFEQMQDEGIVPNNVTFSCILKACSSIEAMDKGREVHAEIARDGFENDFFVSSSLVDMYARSGSHNEAYAVIDELAFPNVVCWTSLISGCVEQGLGDVALDYFDSMSAERVSPNAVTLVCALKACSVAQTAIRAQQVHMDIVKLGFESNHFIENTLIDIYGKFGLLVESESMLRTLPSSDIIAWNNLLSGYTEHCNTEVFTTLDDMQLQGICPNSVTYLYVLKACGCDNSIAKGLSTHSEIVKRGLIMDCILSSTLIDMYAKCGYLEEAHKVFEQILDRDVVSWNTLIGGYAFQGHVSDALDHFQQLQIEGLSPTIASWNILIECCAEYGKSEKLLLELYTKMLQQGVLPDNLTYLSILKACGNNAALEFGFKVHARLPAISVNNLYIETALIDMYGKCGSMLKAQKVFDHIALKDTCTWSALIAGYTRSGESKRALALFDEMMKTDVEPDEVVFLCVLTACSHAGQVQKGVKYFEMMTEVYGITPTLEHHSSVIDLLGRAGQLDDAVDMIRNLPSEADDVVWSTILSACRKWGNVRLARMIFDKVQNLVLQHEGMYMTMLNMYADAHMWKEAEELMALRIQMQSHGIPDKTWVELNDILCEVESKDSQSTEFIGKTATRLVNEDFLCSHSVGLALDYGYGRTQTGKPVHIVYNKNICNSCHATLALSTKDKRIVVICREVISLHVFSSGKCTCGN